jgi:hypothetical protein
MEVTSLDLPIMRLRDAFDAQTQFSFFEVCDFRNGEDLMCDFRHYDTAQVIINVWKEPALRTFGIGDSDCKDPKHMKPRVVFTNFAPN